MLLLFCKVNDFVRIWKFEQLSTMVEFGAVDKYLNFLVCIFDIQVLLENINVDMSVEKLLMTFCAMG
jgi:hypothetical protein